MKQAGIVAGNYKLDKFEEELVFAGFTRYKIQPFAEDTSSILVEIEQEEMEVKLKELRSIVMTVEMYFKRRN